MVPEILNGWLWQARLAIRSASARAFAAHGYVDPSYRPPRLPFVSVVGPLSLHVEPERENGKAAQARMRIPGFVVGKPRTGAATIPAAGGLRLRFDGRATVTLALAGMPTTPFSDPATGPAIATRIASEISAALAANEFLDSDGSPLSDPTLLAALEEISVQWSSQTHQLAIASDSGTPATQGRSSVEILSTSNDLSLALGLSPPETSSEGRQKLHKLPAPRSMTVETRLDLWSQSQVDMAVMFDGLASAAPTRGRLVLRPSLLARDVADGDTQIQLLDRGEPTTRDSLIHLEGGDGLKDRAKGIVFTASAGASTETQFSRFVLNGSGQITGPVWARPLVPDPLFSAQPAPGGFALAIGIDLDPNVAEGDAYRLLALRQEATTVLSIALAVVRINVPGSGQVLFGELTATGTLLVSGFPTTATTKFRVLLSQLRAGGTLHASVSTETGLIALAWNGEPQRLDDPIITPTPPVGGVGAPATGPDMVMTLGGGSAAPFPRPVGITHVHLQGEPYGPLDPKLRTSVTGRARLRPGDMIAISGSDDGWRIGETKSLALVERVDGVNVILTKPIEGTYPRGRAIVFQDECFFFQTAVKRRDDLMNRLYHCSIDYRVSALLEDPIARSSSVLVREHQEEIVARGASRAPGAHPGVTAVEADTTRGVN